MHCFTCILLWFRSCFLIVYNSKEILKPEVNVVLGEEERLHSQYVGIHNFLHYKSASSLLHWCCFTSLA